EGSVWRYYYKPGNTCPASGIYRCTNCGDEVTCNKDDPLPPQNHRQHNVPGDIRWELVVMTKTK
ncbi:protein L, partial [Escherichia coli]|nr:protein L [Escherichia coli]